MCYQKDIPNLKESLFDLSHTMEVIISILMEQFTPLYINIITI